MKKTLTFTFWLMLLPLMSLRLLSAQTYEEKIESYHISPTFTYKSIQLVPQVQASNIFGQACFPLAGSVLADTDITEQSISLRFCPTSGFWAPLPGIWHQEVHQIILLRDIATSPSMENIRVGIGTSDPEFKLTLDNDGGILSLGVEDAAAADFSIIPQNAYAMFLWYSKKGALRAQKTTNTSTFWDEDSIGIYSIALGEETEAKAFASLSSGSLNNVAGPLSAITGGRNNHITTQTDALPTTKASILGSMILGGMNHTIAGPGGNIIGAGRQNTITNASSSAIMGGQTNTINAGMSGFTETSSNYHNLSGRTHSLILSGSTNSITSTEPGNAIGGGILNQIVSGSRYSSIVNGYNNMITNSAYSFIGGGFRTKITNSPYSAIGSGNLNQILNASHAVILGGTYTYTSYPLTIDGGDFSSVGIGRGQIYRLTGHHSTVITNHGAGRNDLSGNFSFIGSGRSADMTGNHSVALAGNTSLIHGDFSITQGASVVAGDFSASHSWGYNYSGDFSWISGGQIDGTIRNYGNRIFVWGWGGWNIPETASDLFILAGSELYPISVGIGTYQPGKTLTVAGTLRTQSLSVETADFIGGSPLKVIDHALSLDLAEEFQTTEPVDPGDVLIISHGPAGELAKSRSAYAKNVIGVVSSAPALLFSENGIVADPEPSAKQTYQAAVALTGRAPVKVSTENGPIEPGDLLTTSSTPGVAMRADDIKRSVHAVIGKALQPFNNPESEGLILAIIMVR